MCPRRNLVRTLRQLSILTAGIVSSCCLLTGSAYAGECYIESDSYICNAGQDGLFGSGELGEPWLISDQLEGPIEIGGWTQIGYHTTDNGMFNSRPNQLQLHQQYLHIEKVTDTECGWDWGFRIDAIYGTDGQDFQAFGSSESWFDNPWDYGRDYGWALPQGYLEIAAGDLSIKIGRFFTLIGYEYGTAVNDFLYSHTYKYYFSEPFTHTGTLATYQCSDETEIYLGWVDGWDTAYEFTGGSQLMGGIQQSLGDAVTLYYVFHVGERERGVVKVGNGYNHSVVFEAELTEKLEAIFQHDLVEYSTVDQSDYGVNQRFIYALNDKLACAIRGEWWHTTADGGTSSDIYALTLGLNVRPQANIVFRPEVRWDWNSDGAKGIGQAGLGAPINRLNGDVTFGMDAVIRF
jgi:hypothetical protein